MRTIAEIKAAIIENMTDAQYYCEKCDQVFEYSYPGQKGCEQCGTQIQDNNIAEVD